MDFVKLSFRNLSALFIHYSNVESDRQQSIDTLDLLGIRDSYPTLSKYLVEAFGERIYIVERKCF